MLNDRANPSPQSPLGQRLWWLILGRAAVAVLLLLIGVFWKKSALGSSFTTSLNSVAPILLSVALLTILYSAARLLWKNFLSQAQVQFFFDVLIVTWLVWLTGDIHSPYTALFIVVISVASLFIGPRGAMIISVGSAAAFNSAVLIAFNCMGPIAARDTGAS